MGVIDFDLQGHIDHFDLELLEIQLVHVMTCNRFELQSPILQQICILGFSKLVSKIWDIDLDLQGYLAILT